MRAKVFWIAAAMCLGGNVPALEAPGVPAAPAGPIAAGLAAAAAEGTQCSPLAGGLVPGDMSDGNQAAADLFSWQNFLAVIANGGYQSWPSTTDLLDDSPYTNDGKDYGSPTYSPDWNPSTMRYVPAACSKLHDQNPSLRILSQVGKVDDNIQEANATGLSNGAVTAANKTFVRYEILISPQMWKNIIDNSYPWQGYAAATTSPSNSAPVNAGAYGKYANIECSSQAATPNDVAGGFMLKMAWMDMAGVQLSGGGSGDGAFITEELLVYTSAERSNSGTASCELKNMGLIGTHLVRKTRSQPAWVWGTFEHRANAPDCANDPPTSGSGEYAANVSCPAPADVYKDAVPSGLAQWNLMGKACVTEGACQTCNTVPAFNGASNGGKCQDSEWCPQEAPAASNGLSQLCRQLPVSKFYPGAQAINEVCAANKGIEANYELISTQWVNWGGVAIPECYQGQMVIQDTSNSIWTGTATENATLQPVLTKTQSSQKPLLGNTSIESYERSSCAGCHRKSRYARGFEPAGQQFLPDPLSIFTDMVWFLGLEVPSGPAFNNTKPDKLPTGK